jgi:uncharacterized delta-60 repeat protein
LPRLRPLFAGFIVIALAIPAAALAGAGDPDPSFNGTGAVSTGFGTTPFHAADSGNAAARDASGRIYIAGTTPANNQDIAVVRLTAGGTLDATFGDNGIATTNVGAANDDRAFAVLIDPTGNVVVAGATGDESEADNFVLLRYTSAGVLDSTFGGGDGIVTTDFFGGQDVAVGVTRLASGNLVAAGYTDSDPSTDTQNNDFAVASYTSSGALDPTFDGDGKLTTDFGSNGDEAFAVRATGTTFVAAGRTDPSGDDAGDFALARYNASTGALDSSFDGDGKETVSFSGGPGNGDFATSLAIDGSNRIVVAGCAGPGNGDFAVARLSGTDGSPDTTFDSDGKQIVSTPPSGQTLGSQDQAYAVAVQADNAIVLGGIEYTNGGKWVLTRVDSTGTVDSSFGTNGFVITDWSSDASVGDQVNGVFIDETNGKIIAAGSGNQNFAAARYSKTDGSLDTAFGPNTTGKVEVDVVSPVASSETATGVAVQPDGKIVVVGPTDAGPTVQSKGDQEFGVARYNPDGTLDAGFGVGGSDGNGRLTTNFGTNPNGTGTNDSPAGVALQSDGKIVVVGTTDPPGSDQGDIALARYESDGTLDPTFGGGDGLVTTDLGGVNGDNGSAVAVEGTPGTTGFRILVAGTKHNAAQSDAFAVAAYNEDGTPDTTFNGTGTQVTDLGSVYPANGLAVQPDGKVLVVGAMGGFFPDPVDFAVVRYDSVGALDNTFGGGDGIVRTDFAGGYDEARGVAVQDLGSGQVRIVVVGRASPDTTSTGDGGVAAYTTDGSLDPSFAPGGSDGDGKLTVPLGFVNSLGMTGVVLQPDGKIVASAEDEASGFGAARIDASGVPDPSFGGDGLVSTPFPNPNSTALIARSVALQADGKIVVAGGQQFAFGGSDFDVARYGAPDTVVTPPGPQPSPPAPPKKKKCKKKKHHRAAAAKKKCKKKRS